MFCLYRGTAGRQLLVYDAFEHVPNGPSLDCSSLSSAQLRAVEHFDTKTAGQTNALIDSMKQAMGGGALPPGEAADEDEDEAADEDEDEDDGDDEGAAADPASMRRRVDKLGAEKVRVFADYLRFNTSRVGRVRFPVKQICGASVVTSGLERPHAGLSLRGHSKCKIDELGEHGDEADSSVAYGLELTDDTIEPLGMLTLDLAAPVGTARGAPAFSSMQMYPVYKPARKHAPCGDWTPGACASSATRHYIIGDLSEIMELARYLASASPHMAALLTPAECPLSLAVPNSLRTSLGKGAGTAGAGDAIRLLRPGSTPAAGSIIAKAVLTARDDVRGAGGSVLPRWRSIGFRPLIYAYAPWGCIVRAGEPTKSRKTPARKNDTALFPSSWSMVRCRRW